MTTYYIDCTITMTTTVMVEANSLDEAQTLFHEGQWDLDEDTTFSADTTINTWSMNRISIDEHESTDEAQQTGEEEVPMGDDTITEEPDDGIHPGFRMREAPTITAEPAVIRGEVEGLEAVMGVL